MTMVTIWLHFRGIINSAPHLLHDSKNRGRASPVNHNMGAASPQSWTRVARQCQLSQLQLPGCRAARLPAPFYVSLRSICCFNNKAWGPQAIAWGPQGPGFVVKTKGNEKRSRAARQIVNAHAFKLTGDARPRFVDELCSKSGGDAREAMTVGCKPTSI